MLATTYSLIRFEVEGSIAKITLNRPDVLNSFNRQMALEVQNALDDAKDSTHVRAILITAEGRAFCAGQDLAEAIAPDGPAMKTIVDEHYNPIIKRIREIEKPVICAVNGVAAGAGANIALACDIVLAAQSASFIQAFSKIGLIPDSGGTFILPRLVGLQRATAMMMLGEKIKAEQALNYGMIYKVCEDAKLQEEALAVTVTLAAMPTRGLGLTKKALNMSLSSSLDEQLSLEGELQAEAGRTYDYREGVNAFLEKRPPAFKGE
jgi:2-(1,2-epoxy-1,2-dihydrophenyl)acetyl-CoA isomerase